MATLRRANDDHFYIIKGYPFENNDGKEDVFFRTLQVGPRADSLFRTLRAKDGLRIEKPLYYCLCVEGEIFFDGKADRPLSPLKIPAEIRYQAEGLYEDSGFTALRNFVVRKEMRSICDVIQEFAKDQFPVRPQYILLMSLARIAWLVRQCLRDEEIIRQRSETLASEMSSSASDVIAASLRNVVSLIPESLSREADVRTFLRQRSSGTTRKRRDPDCRALAEVTLFPLIWRRTQRICKRPSGCS
ncbi:MAG: hypothetical protein JO347_01260 [Candidatus Eremiobacteraeota bacterium]|nr:hypothetical protein [Candidatus Eremiobacteraeota bacterium]